MRFWQSSGRKGNKKKSTGLTADVGNEIKTSNAQTASSKDEASAPRSELAKCCGYAIADRRRTVFLPPPHPGNVKPTWKCQNIRVSEVNGESRLAADALALKGFSPRRLSESLRCFSSIQLCFSHPPPPVTL